jgi:hypothetical protein
MNSAAEAGRDSAIRKALAVMGRAGRDVVLARRRLRCALKELEGHREYVKSARGRRAGRPVAEWISLAYWVHDRIKGWVEEVRLEETGRLLLSDSNPKNAAATMRRYVEQDRRDSARFAKRRRAS